MIVAFRGSAAPEPDPLPGLGTGFQLRGFPAKDRDGLAGRRLMLFRGGGLVVPGDREDDADAA